MSSDYFTPMNDSQKILKKWWLLFLAALLGGIIGFLVSAALPPRYEAAAKISTQLDYTDAVELADYEENRAINEVGWVSVSDSVLIEVQRLMNAKGHEITWADIVDTFSVERVDDLWMLRVTHTDPKTAADFANIWADEAYRQLTEAYGHALAADSIQTYISALESCTRLPASETAALALCATEDADTLYAEIMDKTKLLEEELRLARLLHPDLQITLVSHAQVPQEATRYQQGGLVFAGAALFFALMLIFLLVQPREERLHVE